MSLKKGEILNVIAPALRRARNAAGLSQEETAARLQLAGWDIGRATYAKIEVGLRRVADAEMVVLAGVLKVPPASLLPSRWKDALAVVRQGRE